MFKNAIVFNYDPDGQSIEELRNDIEESADLVDPTGHAKLSKGWLPIHDTLISDLISPSKLVVKLGVRKKIVPPKVFKRALEKTQATMDASDIRYKLSELKDEVMLDLLNVALVEQVETLACIDFNNNLLIVDTSSNAVAEDVVDLLRTTSSSGSFKVKPAFSDMIDILTDTVNFNLGLSDNAKYSLLGETGVTPLNIRAGSDFKVELDDGENKSTYTFKNMIVENSSLVKAMDNYYKCVSMSFVYENMLFTVTENGYRSIKFLDIEFESSDKPSASDLSLALCEIINVHTSFVEPVLLAMED